MTPIGLSVVGLHTSVSFVKTGDGIDPVSLVHTICKDAHSKPDQKRSRFIKRMTPMTLMRKTMGGGLEHVCQSVLRPHFHAGGPAKKVSKDGQFHRAFPLYQVTSSGGLLGSSLIGSLHGDPSAELFAQANS
jgi:hypothetical protein